MTESQSTNTATSKQRTGSMSQTSESSQTAADYIKEQLDLEAEAREALPYQFDTCTRDLGPLRQGLYACLTCNPPPEPSGDSGDSYVPAAVCYACSISCHGEHTLVELFNKRNFVCDCGTIRLPAETPCTLRINSATGQKGQVTGEEPAKSNKYNQNFRNKFCGCGEQYDPHQEKGTMFQCLGLGTVENGGCGEDWWHPECVIGLSREEFAKSLEKPKPEQSDGQRKKSNGFITKEVSVTREEEDANGQTDERRPSIVTAIAAGVANGSGVDGNDIAADEDDDDEDVPLPPGFPSEDDFEYFLCYKCVESHPWIKKYAGAPGFLPPVYHDATLATAPPNEPLVPTTEGANGESKKRKADDSDTLAPPASMAPPKRQKSEDPATLSSIPESSSTTTLPLTPKKPEPPSSDNTKSNPNVCKLPGLPAPAISHPTTPFSLFMLPDFRTTICHCATCFPLLKPHNQLLEEEDVYEPPMSDTDPNENSASVGTGSILDRGEAAFSNMDRMQAIQGAKAYAHLKENLRGFLKPFAEQGKVVDAESIKAYFEKLRGDEQGIRSAAEGAKGSKEDEGGDGGGEGDNRREQSGY